MTQAVLDKPPKEDVEKQLIEALRNAAAIASELCGFPAGGLTDVHVEVKSQLLGNSEFTSRESHCPSTQAWRTLGRRTLGRRTVPRTPGRRTPGRRTVADIPRALFCAGVVAGVMNAELSDDFQGRKNWHLVGDGPIEVKGIETPGVTFDEAGHRASSGGNHHTHH